MHQDPSRATARATTVTAGTITAMPARMPSIAAARSRTSAASNGGTAAETQQCWWSAHVRGGFHRGRRSVRLLRG